MYERSVSGELQRSYRIIEIFQTAKAGINGVLRPWVPRRWKDGVRNKPLRSEWDRGRNMSYTIFGKAEDPESLFNWFWTPSQRLYLKPSDRSKDYYEVPLTSAFGCIKQSKEYRQTSAWKVFWSDHAHRRPGHPMTWCISSSALIAISTQSAFQLERGQHQRHACRRINRDRNSRKMPRNKTNRRCNHFTTVLLGNVLAFYISMSLHLFSRIFLNLYIGQYGHGRGRTSSRAVLSCRWQLDPHMKRSHRTSL